MKGIRGAGAGFYPAVTAALSLWIYAAAPVAQPPPLRAVDPGILSEDARRDQERSRPHAASPRAGATTPPEDAVPEGAEDAYFIYRGLRISGASVLDARELESLWPHRPGDTVSVAEVYAFAAAVTRAYRAAGYVLSHAVVPVQKIRDGTVRIQVVEGFVDSVLVRGALPGKVRERIRRRARAVMADRPATLSGIERGLLLAGDLPGLSVQGTLSPGERPGGARLTIDAAYDSSELLASFANSLPETLNRVVLSTIAEARVGAAGLLRGSASASRGSHYRHVFVLGRMAVGEAGAEVGLSGARTRTRPEGENALGALRYRGRSEEVEVFASRPLVRGRWKNTSMGIGLSSRRYRSRLAGESVRDRLWTLHARGDYTRRDRAGALTAAGMTLSQGLDVRGATGGSRLGGSPRFTALELRARTRRALGSWAGGTVSLTSTVHGQTALGARALLSGAECYYGGRRFGVGFDSGALSGDHCAMTALQLEWTRTVSVPGASTPVRFGLHGALDGGWVRQKGPLEAGERRSDTAVSGKLGVRLLLPARGFSVELGVSGPLSVPRGTTDPGVRINIALGVRL